MAQKIVERAIDSYTIEDGQDQHLETVTSLWLYSNAIAIPPLSEGKVSSIECSAWFTTLDSDGVAISSGDFQESGLVYTMAAGSGNEMGEFLRDIRDFEAKEIAGKPIYIQWDYINNLLPHLDRVSSGNWDSFTISGTVIITLNDGSGTPTIKNIKIGSTTVNKIYAGLQEVKKIYVGTHLVWDTNSSTPTPPPTPVMRTKTDILEDKYTGGLIGKHSTIFSNIPTNAFDLSAVEHNIGDVAWMPATVNTTNLQSQGKVEVVSRRRFTGVTRVEVKLTYSYYE